MFKPAQDVLLLLSDAKLRMKVFPGSVLERKYTHTHSTV